MAAVVVALRRSLRRQRVFRDRTNPLDSMSDAELYDAFRFFRHELMDLCDEITEHVEHASHRQGALPPILQVRHPLECLSYFYPVMVTPCRLGVCKRRRCGIAGVVWCFMYCGLFKCLASRHIDAAYGDASALPRPPFKY